MKPRFILPENFATQSGAADLSTSKTALAARVRSFRYAFEGIVFLFRNEPNARIHLAASLAAMGAGLYLDLGWADWRWILLAMALVWIAEALNTAVEQVCNLVCPGPSPQVKAAKDVAAAAVLVAAIAPAAIGAATYIPAAAASVG